MAARRGPIQTNRRRVRPKRRSFAPFRLRLLIARMRYAMACHRVLHRVPLLIVVVVLVAGARSASRQVQAAEQRWGELVTVTRVVADAQAGTPLDQIEMVEISVPASNVTADVLGEIPGVGFAARSLRPGDLLTRRDIAASFDEVLVPGKLSERDDRLIPAGHLTVAISNDLGSTHLRLGDVVDLVRVRFEELEANFEPTGAVVAASAVVVGRDANSIALAVEADVVSEVVTAIARSEVIPVLRTGLR